jgi:hypothetical protein
MTTTETREARAEPRVLSPEAREMLADVYEQWVAYPDKRELALYRDHASMANRKGWFVSGWRGLSDQMLPLSEELSEFFEREH